MKYYWYTACVNCGLGGGGRLTLFEDETLRSLYLHCDECERRWRDPEQVNDLQRSFSTLAEDFTARAADWPTIQRHG